TVLGDAAKRLGVLAEYESVRERGARMLMTGERVNPDSADAEYDRRWGARAEDVIATARRVFAGLPAEARHFLTSSSLVDDPDLIELLARLAPKMPALPNRPDLRSLNSGSPAHRAELARHERAYQRVYGRGEA